MASRLLTTNLAATTLGAGIAGNSGATSLTVYSGTGALFPALPYAGDFFMGVLVNSFGQTEIVKVTGRTGDVLTVERGQEGTTIRAYSLGDRFELRLTAASIDHLGGTYWSRESGTPLRVDGTHFTVPGDLTSRYVAGRAVGAIQTTTDVGYVVGSSYSSGTGLTTVEVEAMTIDAGLVAVEYGQDPTSAPKYGAYPDASEAQKGLVELASSAETQTGTDTTRAVTPAGLQSRIGSGPTQIPTNNIISVPEEVQAAEYLFMTGITR